MDLMLHERMFVIAVIIGVALIISTISLVSVPLNSEQDNWWSYNTMKKKIIETKASSIIEIEENMKFESRKDGT